MLREIQLPAVGTAGGFGGKKKHYITPLLIIQRQNNLFFDPNASQLYMRSQV
jgi:hypothetical protein